MTGRKTPTYLLSSSQVFCNTWIQGYLFVNLCDHFEWVLHFWCILHTDLIDSVYATFPVLAIICAQDKFWIRSTKVTFWCMYVWSIIANWCTSGCELHICGSLHKSDKLSSLCYFLFFVLGFIIHYSKPLEKVVVF